MADEPTIAAREPAPVEVKQGETYWWCRCGRSKNQPFCDGSHKDTSFEPMEFTAPKDQKIFFCQCKHTAQAPMCDGTHNRLET